MRKKQSRGPTNQAELPLGSPSDQKGVDDSDARAAPSSRPPPTPGRYARSHAPAVFEFEESQPKAPTPGSPDEASKVSEEAPEPRPESVEMQGSETEDRSEAERMFENAKSASRGGRMGEAIGLYRRVVAMDPVHVRARNNLGVLFDQAGDHEVALEHFREAIGLEPENPEILTNLGASLAAQGRYDDAEIHLKRAARLDPSGVDVRANLGILYFRRGLYAQADQELRWVCDHDADHALAHFYRGEALNRLGRVDDALEMLERASHLQPDRARVYYLMGILYDKKNLRQEAGVMYRKARELTNR